MIRFKLFGVLRHAVVMVGRTIRSYAMLSVTIVLSFSLLLGYLLFTDAGLYNAYKELFAMRRGDVIINDQEQNQTKTSLFLQHLDAIEGTDYYICYHANFGHDTRQYNGTAIGLAEGEMFTICNQFAILFPDHIWLDGMDLRFSYEETSSHIVWLGEDRESFTLEADEILLSEKIYLAMGIDAKAEPVYTLRSDSGANVELRVAGYIKSPVALDFSADSWLTTPPCYLSTKFIDAAGILDTDTWGTLYGHESTIYAQSIVIYSESPERVVALAEQMGYSSYFSVYEQQNEALEHIRNEKGNKAIIACALLLLLGINLYSSFTNALNDRKFEIGVKRAIGASAGSIVRQFLYESVIVMVANTVISIALVADVFIVYKYIYERIPDLYGNYNTWTIYISPHSVAMFGLCAVTLTVVFSLIFAYKSTRVEIVQYLKAE